MADNRNTAPAADDAVTAADELARRPSRPPDHEAENRALRGLAETMAGEPGDLLQRLAEAAAELTASDSAGVSLLVPGGGERVALRCVAATGAPAGGDPGGAAPREANPWGEAVARGAVLLLKGAGHAPGAAREALLAPFRVGGEPAGTVWAVKHAPGGRFDREDARLLEGLAGFASAAHGAARALGAAREAGRESAELHRAALEGGRVAGWRWDRRSRTLLCDPAFAALWGVPHHGGPIPVGAFQRRMTPEGVAATEAVMAGAMAPGEEFDGEIEVASGPAAPRWVRWRGRAEAGRPWVINGVAFDATEHRRERERLRESEERYRALFASMDQACAVVEVVRDASGRWSDFLFLEVNPAFMWHTGMPCPVGRTATELLGTPNPRWAETYGRVAETGEPVRFEEAEITLGRVFDLNVFRLGGPGSRRVAVLFSDVTERKRAEERLRAGEARFRALATAGSYAVYRMSPDWGEMRQLDGRGFIADTPAPNRSWLEAYIHPDDRPRVLAAIRDAIRSKRVFELEHRVLRADGGLGWTLSRAVPLLDEGGEVTEWIGAASDATARRAAEAALRESEQRFRMLAEAIEDVFYITDLDRRALDYLSPAYERVWGRPAAELHADLGSFIETLQPDDRPAFVAAKEAQRRGEPAVVEYRVSRPDGSVRWIFDRSFPIGGQAGRRAAGIASDITARKRAEQALADSERRLRSLVEGLPQAVWRSAGDGEWTWASPQWSARTGLSEAASRGRGWLDAVHPDDRDAVLAAWRGAEAEGSFRADHRLFHAAEGRHRWAHGQALPVRDGGGRVVEWLGTTTDVHDLRRAHEQEILIAELQHRTRNLLTVVGGVAEQTLATSGSLGEFGDRFGQRLSALGRVQGLLSREVAPNVTVRELARLELAAHGLDSAGADRVRLAGPEVALPARTVQLLALALHELLTNALKHSALGAPGGRLGISWAVVRRGADGRGRLRLDWVEAGVPTTRAGPPGRRGFGLDLIEVGLPYELDAAAKVEFAPDGLRCSIVLPLGDAAGPA